MVTMMQSIINKGGAMKLPSLRNIERVIKMVPLVKEILPNNGDSGLLEIIKNKEDALHDKKAEICKLREKISELEKANATLLDACENQTWMLDKKQQELDGERR